MIIPTFNKTIQANNLLRLDLEKIDPKVVARMKISDFDELIRQGEILLSVQIENIRSIDKRALALITNISVFISLFALILTNENEFAEKLLSSPCSRLIIIAVGLLVIISFFSCIIVIKSSPIKPHGNTPTELLKDITQGLYSSHECKVDYSEGLSRRFYCNEKLVSNNGRCLSIASILILISYVLIVLLVGIAIFK